MTFTEVKALYGVRSWRKVKGFSFYRITHCGRLWSLRQNKFVQQYYNLDSYKRVELKKNGGRTWAFVHRLVAFAYKRNRHPRKQTQVNHKDWDKHNNNGWNLEWCTPGENVAHAKNKHNSRLEYKGSGRWKKISYEEAQQRSGAPF